MKPSYAGFWVRTLASIADFVIVFTASWAVETVIVYAIYRPLKALGRIHSGIDDFMDPAAVQGLSLGIYLAISAGYYIPAHFRQGATLGKRWLRLRVVQSGSGASITLSQSVLRWIGYGPSYFLMGAGYLMVALHPKKRGLHDLFGRTEVRRDPFSDLPGK